jgi:hypothetical protein
VKITPPDVTTGLISYQEVHSITGEAIDSKQEMEERSKPWQSETTGRKRSRPLSDGKTVIVL